MTVPSDPSPAGGGTAGAPPPADRRFSLQKVILALVMVVAILAVALIAVLAGGGDEAGATEVQTEAVSTSGANPFMPSVGTDEPDVTPPPKSAGSFPADTPGLYGGTMREGSCDVEALISFLEANPDKAAAFASVQGIRTADIRSYVSKLTPVVLRSDTAVTNHGFSNGRATTIPAVLQAGTAVLVDQFGTPRVKCFCGNPLTERTKYADPVYVGSRWPAFEPNSITIIQETTVIIEIFVLVDPATGDAFSRPAGTSGTDDGPAPDQPSTTTSAPRGRIPSDATYNITIGGGTAECSPFSVTTTATVAGGTLTLQATQPISGPVASDGSFTIDASVGGASTHIEGRLDANTLTAEATEAGCTYSITGTRAGA